MSLFCVIFFSSWLKGIIYAFIDFLSSRNNAVKNFFVFFYYYCVLCFCYCKRSIYLEQFYNLFSFFVLLLCFSFSLAVCSKSLVFFIQTRYCPERVRQLLSSPFPAPPSPQLLAAKKFQEIS